MAGGLSPTGTGTRIPEGPAAALFPPPHPSIQPGGELAEPWGGCASRASRCASKAAAAGDMAAGAMLSPSGQMGFPLPSPPPPPLPPRHDRHTDTQTDGRGLAGCGHMRVQACVRRGGLAPGLGGGWGKERTPVRTCVLRARVRIGGKVCTRVLVCTRVCTRVCTVGGYLQVWAHAVRVWLCQVCICVLVCTICMHCWASARAHVCTPVCTHALYVCIQACTCACTYVCTFAVCTDLGGLSARVCPRATPGPCAGMLPCPHVPPIPMSHAGVASWQGKGGHTGLLSPCCWGTRGCCCCPPPHGRTGDPAQGPPAGSHPAVSPWGPLAPWHSTWGRLLGEGN